MGYIEDLGETVIKLFYRVSYYIIGFLIFVIGAFRKIKEKTGISFYNYFEKKGIEEKDYAVLKTQISVMLFLFLSVIYIFEFSTSQVIIVGLILIGSYFLSLLTSLKKYYASDFPAYRDFFLSYFGISLVLLITKIIKPTVKVGFQFLHLFAISIILVGAVSIVFKKKYGRDYTFGKVIEVSSERMMVKVNYDLMAGTKPGVYIFENNINARVGDTLKLLTKRGLFNLRGSRVIEVLEKI
jgi:uncharacterized membrane protein